MPVCPDPKMKAGRTRFAVTLLVCGALLLYFLGGPWSFIDRPLHDESLRHLRTSAAGAPWAASPGETALEYLYWWAESDRPRRDNIDIHVSMHTGDDAVVTVTENGCQDDSLSRLCSRITMRRQDGLWIPVRHQAAWQGRGRIGWTTLPTK